MLTEEKRKDIVIEYFIDYKLGLKTLKEVVMELHQLYKKEEARYLYLRLCMLLGN